MSARRIRVPLIMGFIPYPIEADWDPAGAHLAGFPLNIVFSDIRLDDSGCVSACNFDPLRGGIGGRDRALVRDP